MGDRAAVERAGGAARQEDGQRVAIVPVAMAHAAAKSAPWSGRAYRVQAPAYFLQEFRSTPDGDGALPVDPRKLVHVGRGCWMVGGDHGLADRPRRRRRAYTYGRGHAAWNVSTCRPNIKSNINLK